MTKMVIPTVILAALAWGAAGTCMGADSIKIVSAVPASGALPISPAQGSVTVTYTLESAPYAMIMASPIIGAPRPVPWPDTQGGKTWVSKGTGQVTLQYAMICYPESPGYPVNTVRAYLFTSQSLNGPTSGSAADSSRAIPGGWIPCKPLPDFTVPARSGLVLGAKAVAWGSSVSLTPADSTECKDGRCRFEAAYDIVNSGGSVNVWPFASRLSLDTPGNILAETSNLVMNQGASRRIQSRIVIPLGTHTVFLAVDPASSAMEANEDNNRFQVTYTLGGDARPLQAAPGGR